MDNGQKMLEVPVPRRSHLCRLLRGSVVLVQEAGRDVRRARAPVAAVALLALLLVVVGAEVLQDQALRRRRRRRRRRRHRVPSGRTLFFGLPKRTAFLFSVLRLNQ